jgi:hypothetical protein
MKRSHTAILIILPFVAACQWLTPPGASVRTAEQATFMDLWRVYDHCRSAQDPETVLLDALVLQRAVNERSRLDVPRLLRPLRKFMDPTPVRLSADPHAMAASCTLRSAEVAMERGWSDLAMQIYTAMIPAYQAKEYAYYLQQARSGLTNALERESIPGPSARMQTR